MRSAPAASASANAPHALSQLLAWLEQVRAESAQTQQQLLHAWHPHIRRKEFLDSAHNMAAYIGLRRHDLREAQQQLAALGLSSLGRTEGHVLANLDAVIHALQALLGQPPPVQALNLTARAFQHNALQQHTDQLFGPPSPHRAVRIMVTLPSEAAGNYTLVKALVERGMDCARINCAHDTPKAWAQMARFVRKASQESGRACKVLMDLAGPKLRTGTLASGHGVIRLKPRRDERGKVVEHCQVILDCSGQPGRAASKDGLGRPLPARLSVDAGWLRRIGRGDRLAFTDLRGKSGVLQIEEIRSDTEVVVTCDRSAYLEEGCLLRHYPQSKHHHPVFDTLLGPVQLTPQPILLQPGDALLLTRANLPGEAAEIDEADNSIIPAHIACAQPAVLDYLQVGQHVLLDDGHLCARVESLTAEGALLRISQARELGVKLGAEKGLNFPDTELHLPALTDKDRADLASVVKHADIVGYSFVQSAADMEQLLAELTRLGASNLGIIAKIETRLAMSNLPEIIVRGGGNHPFGVMIARGDLAVEVGYENLAETQEEILWLCEAAQVPVIWATQVLESLVKQNIPTRAEVTDAAMAERAECVMLNKGPFVLEAMDVLDHLVARMQSHQTKKTAQMRPLNW